MQLTRTHVGSPLAHPLFDKFTPQHLDKFLDYSHQDDLNAYTFSSSNRIFHFAYFGVAVAFLIFLIVFPAPTNKDLLAEILKVLVVFSGGFGAGFGWKSIVSKK